MSSSRSRSETLRGWVGQDDKGKRPSGDVVEGSDAEKDARIAALECCVA
ncbi:MAG: hypothetical protein JO100_15695 [Pseudonocardia sp.]|nr:hypothetical protein [Pseudonocardia sp.]